MSADGNDLLPIERLAFVADGRLPLLGSSYWLGSEEPLLVGRFEVTRAEWRAWAEKAGAPVPPEPALGPWAEEEDSLPATGMDFTEATAFAAAHDMRLPTVTEWAWCVAGPRGLAYPYGNVATGSSGNTAEVGLGRATAPGAFPVGRTPVTGIFDLFGNVEEWARWTSETDWIPSHSEHSGSDGLGAWAMGGSWRGPSRRLFKLGKAPNLVGRELEPAHRSQSIGLRLFADARGYLVGLAPGLSRSRLEERIVSVGRGWGQSAVPLLTELTAGPDAPLALHWLLQGARQ